MCARACVHVCVCVCIYSRNINYYNCIATESEQISNDEDSTDFQTSKCNEDIEMSSKSGSEKRKRNKEVYSISDEEEQSDSLPHIKGYISGYILHYVANLIIKICLTIFFVMS